MNELICNICGCEMKKALFDEDYDEIKNVLYYCPKDYSHKKLLESLSLRELYEALGKKIEKEGK